MISHRLDISVRFVAWEKIFLFATKFTCVNLIPRSGPAEWYDAAFCTLPLDMTCESGLVTELHTSTWVHPASHSMGNMSPSPSGQSSWHMKSTINFNLIPHLKSLEVYLLYLHAFMTWCLDTGTLLLYLSQIKIC